MSWFSRQSAGTVRPPAVAGRFYPGDPAALRAAISEMLAVAPPGSGPAPKALIVPHAGYRFSGPVAASAYAALERDREVIRRVVLLGPAHFAAFEGVAASCATAFATPLGQVKVDVAEVQRLLAAGLAQDLPRAHAFEHCLEVQLPFLQTVLNDFSIVPLLAGEADPGQLGRVVDELWGGAETRIIISSDLSHNLDCASARQLDEATARAIEALDPGSVGEDQACGQLPILGLLGAGAAHGLRARTLDLRNSSDTGGPPERVVGYGAFAFHPRAELPTPNFER
jgi:MEMO1 family protein